MSVSISSEYGTTGRMEIDESPQVCDMIAEGSPVQPEPETELEKFLRSGLSLADYVFDGRSKNIRGN